MSDIDELTKLIIKFRDERNWKQFHDPKNSSTHLLLEATEVLELFAWMGIKEAKDYLAKNNKDLADELSDVLSWILILAHDNNINLKQAFIDKMKRNGTKYPIEKSAGQRKKYTQL